MGEAVAENVFLGGGLIAGCANATTELQALLSTSSAFHVLRLPRLSSSQQLLWARRWRSGRRNPPSVARSLGVPDATCGSARNLGVDAHSGKRCGRRCAVREARLAKAKDRLKRIVRFRRASKRVKSEGSCIRPPSSLQNITAHQFLYLVGTSSLAVESRSR